MRMRSLSLAALVTAALLLVLAVLAWRQQSQTSARFLYGPAQPVPR